MLHWDAIVDGNVWLSISQASSLVRLADELVEAILEADLLSWVWRGFMV
jgi:hypothetical protein